jgi:hypothetical protein
MAPSTRVIARGDEGHTVKASWLGAIATPVLWLGVAALL